MRKYYDPKIKISNFLSENVVTESGVNNDYIEEVDLFITRMSPQQYKARVEKVSNLLKFKN